MIDHPTNRATRIAVAMRMFVVLSVVVMLALHVVTLVLGPRVRTIDCVRASAACTISRKWAWSSEASFPMSQLRGFTVENHKLAWQGQSVSYWTNTAPPRDREQLRAAVAELNKFPDGSAPSLHVDVPQGPELIPWSGAIFSLVFGAWVFIAVRRTITRTTIDLAGDNLAVRVTRAPLGTRSTTIPRSAIRRVALRHVRGYPNYVRVKIILETTSEQLEVISEYAGSDPVPMRELATLLAGTLDVELVDGTAA